MNEKIFGGWIECPNINHYCKILNERCDDNCKNAGFCTKDKKCFYGKIKFNNIKYSDYNLNGLNKIKIKFKKFILIFILTFYFAILNPSF